jgi:crotonobetainyl-CoA:carnitine CoA-transferase CaiB-like acyl-CoA transferase
MAGLTGLARRDFTPEATGPLQGLRVLDLSRLVCGNTLTLMLADFGAEVIKVETPTGDTLRDWKVGGYETSWKVLGRNKKSLCLDLRKKRATELLLQLVAGAAVLVESFRPGTLEQMGLGPDVLHRTNPRLVIVRISGWGQTGPYRRRPGFGTLVEGMSGFAAMNGFPDREPVLPPNSLADSVAGFAGAMATLAAVRAVEVGGGKGQVVDLPLFDPLFSILGPQAANYQVTGKVKQRSGSSSTTAAPRNVYRAKDDKWVSLSASTQAMTERLFRSIGRAELIDDPRYRRNADRIARARELDAIIGEFIGRMTQDETVAFFEKEEVTIAPIYDISQIVADPHFQARESVVALPDADLGHVQMQGIPVKLSATPGAFFRPAPRLGEHNAAVLGALGVSAAEFERLRAEGVIIDGARASAEAEGA